MRYKSYVLVAAALMAAAPLAFSQIDSTKLSITGYQLVSETPASMTASYFTYRASVINTGPSLGAITATVTTSTPSVVVAPGQGNLHFAGVPHNTQIASTNSFTILVDRTANFSFNQLQWSFGAPVANAGPDQTVGLGATVTLNASGSTNPSGLGTLSYSWAFTMAPVGSTAVLVNPNSVSPTFVADKAGNFVVTVTVSNSAGSDTASVTISDSNSAPVANAGPNQSVPAGTTVHLDGSKSSDVDGNPLTYSWTLLQRPQGSQANLVGSTTVAPIFFADLAGSYLVQLVVNDGSTPSAPSFVTITTLPGNTPPVANAGPNQVVTVGAVVQLDGSKSTDADGNPITYKWSLTTVPSQSKAALSNPNIVNPTFTADLAGTYVAQLIVNDGMADSTPATVTITTSTTQAPTANAGPNQTVKHGATVNLSGSGTDPQSLPLTFHWSLLNKPANSNATLSNPSISNPTFLADLPGTYVAQLIVNNGVLNSSPSSVTITTTNTAPVANAGPAQTVASGESVTLNGNASSDADNDPITFKWSILNKPTGSNASLQFANTVSPTFIADVAGAFVIQLIVNDGFVDSAPSTVTITSSAGAVLSLTPNPVNLFTNAPGSVTISIGIPAGVGGLPVTLTAFDTTIATVPSTVTIPAGSMSTTATITPKGVGSTTLFASATNFQPGSTTIQVTQPALALSLSGTNVGLAKTATGTVTLPAPAPAPGVTVNLVSSGNGTVTLPASIVIATGATVGTFQLTGSVAGTATVTASATGYAGASQNISVTTVGAITLQSGAVVAVGSSVPFGVTLVTPAPVGGTTVTLVSSDTSKLTVTPSVFIAAGATSPSTSAQISGINLGSASVTASAPGYLGASATVQVAENLNFVPNSVSIIVGTGQNITLTLAGGTPQTAIPVTFTADVTGVVNFPASVSIPPGNNSVTIPVSGASIGTANITASTTISGILSGTVKVTIVPNVSIVTTSLPGGAIGATYNAQVTATGGNAPYTFAVSGLAAGLTMNSSGLITGTPSSVGTTTATVTVTDSTNPTHQTASANFPITISAGVTITTTSLPSGTSGSPYVASVTATGGSTPYTFTVSGLAAGLTMNSSGAITGTPTTPGTTTATFTVTDSSSPSHLTSTANLPITINPALAITNTSLPGGVVGSAYPGATIAATGGSGPYTFTVSGLAAGLTMNSAGVISGTPTSSGTTSATFTVTDSSSPTHLTKTASLSIAIIPALAITNTPLPGGTAGSPYVGTTVTATGGTSPYTFTVTGLAAGLTMNSAGVISGTPTAAGTTQASFTVTDSTTPTHLTATATLSITINPGLAITTASLPGGLAGTIYVGATISASGGSGPYSFSVTGLPTGLTLSSAGVITGTPTTPGTTSPAFTVTDSTSPTHLTSTSNIPITILAPLNFTTTSPLSNGAVGVAYNVTLGATGGTTPYSFTVTGLPAGLTMNSAGVISGSPTTAATTSPAFTVTDSTNPTHLTKTVNFSITINAALAVTTASPLPGGVVNTVYVGTTLTAAGGTGPYSFAVSGLPAGLTMNSAGVISGTPTTAGTTSANVTVTDSSTPTHLTATASLSITINPPLAITTASLPNGVATTPYIGATIAATGGNGPYTFTVSGLAPGLTMNTAGVISGTPTTAGTTSATFTVTDSTTPTHLTKTATLSITINPALVITTTSLPGGVATSAYVGATIAATGGNGPYTFTVSGLAPGLTMNTAGVISGTPTTAGTTSATFTVTDSTTPTHLTATKSLSITINPALTVTTTSLPGGVATSAYVGATIAATGGNGPYTFTVSGLAPGLTMNTAGVISGTPSTAGTTSATFTVTDSTTPTALTATKSLSITINPALAITTASLPNGVATVAYVGATIAATGGNGPYTFTVSGLAPGLTMNTAGVISGTPTTAGTTSATFTVTDSTTPTHLTKTASLSITINPALAITTPSLPGGVATFAYGGATIAATGGNGPYTFTVSGLAPGLTMNSSGVISGTPTTAGTTSATFTVTDSTTPTHLTATASLSITVNPALVITTTSLPNAVATTAYAGATIAATGGNTPYTFTVSGLAAGLTMNSAGVISGTPTSVGTTSATFTVTDSSTPTHFSVSKSLSITTIAPLVITTSSLPAGTSGSLYSASVSASGGTPAYTFTATGLPTGLTMSVAGQISGTPSSFGTTTVTVTVTDSTSPTHLTTVSNLPINILPGGAAISVTGTSVGQNLQSSIIITLSQAPGGLGASVTISSNNPGLVNFAGGSQDAGSGVLTVQVAANVTQFSVFARGLANSGSVTVTASASGFAPGQATVSLTPSALVIAGPNGIGGSFNSNQGAGTALTISAVQLDSSGNPTVAQQLAGNLNPVVTLAVADGTIGSVSPASLTFAPGASTAASQFNALSKAGTTTITVNEPTGFTTPAASANVVAVTVVSTSVVPQNVSVGFDMENQTFVTFGGFTAAPITVTVTSSDPTKLLFSVDGTAAADPSGVLSLTVPAGVSRTGNFFVYGLANSGTVTYTANVPGIGSGTGTVTLMKSGFILSGPFGAGQNFSAIAGSSPSQIDVQTALLDASGNVVGQQALAGGLTKTVALSSSNTAVGTITPPTPPGINTITGGNAVDGAPANFQGLTQGTTTISITAQPAGFTAPTAGAALVATVGLPLIIIDSGNAIGNGLEQPGTIILTATPSTPTVVTLTATGGAMLFSATANGAGANPLQITVPAGSNSASYFMYGQANTGTVTVSGTATNFRPGSGTESLVPAGIVVQGNFGGSTISTTVGGSTTFTVSTGQLDASGNFIQAQALAGNPGNVPLTVHLNDSQNGAIGTFTTSVPITPGTNTSTVTFTGKAVGSTTISATQPTGFTPPSNVQNLTATVH